MTTQGETLFAGAVISGPYAIPGQYVTGVWDGDDSGAVGFKTPWSLTTDDNGNGYVDQGRIYANWDSTVYWGPPGCNGYRLNDAEFNNVNPLIGINWLCQTPEQDQNGNSSTHFALSGAAPSTITSYGDFSTTYGEPKLRVYVGGESPGLLSSVSASSVVAGSSATFPFPTRSGGAALAQGFYGLVNTNVVSGGNVNWVNSSYLAVGGSTTLPSAFGVDAVDTFITTVRCVPNNPKPPRCIRTENTSASPIFTQYNSNQVDFGGTIIPVGVRPVAAKLYGSYSTTRTSGTGVTTTTTTTFSPNAIVVNSGSNSVSLVNVVTTSTTVAVGTQPRAVTLNSANTMAYVANYGSGTLSEVNLTTNAVSRTAPGVAGALSVAMAPSGSYVWVGGANYLYKVNLSTFTVVSSVSVAGTVTSLAASNAQNELVYTLVQNCCSASSTYAAFTGKQREKDNTSVLIPIIPGRGI